MSRLQQLYRKIIAKTNEKDPVSPSISFAPDAMIYLLLPLETHLSRLTPHTHTHTPAISISCQIGQTQQNSTFSKWTFCSQKIGWCAQKMQILHSIKFEIKLCSKQTL